MNKLITGVIGAGVMGTGVAQNLAQAGHLVLLIDVTEDILKCAKENIVNSIRLQKLWRKGVQQEEVDDVLERITAGDRQRAQSRVRYLCLYCFAFPSKQDRRRSTGNVNGLAMCCLQGYFALGDSFAHFSPTSALIAPSTSPSVMTRTHG